MCALILANLPAGAEEEEEEEGKFGGKDGMAESKPSAKKKAV